MNKNRLLIIALMALLGFGFAMTDAMVAGMSKVNKKQLVGSWALVSITNTLSDKRTIQGFGQNDGVVIFERNGRFVQTLTRSDLPKFASNNRNTGTPDENKAVIQGSLSLFGTYTINNDGALTLHIDRSTFPNWNGTDQKRAITSLTGNELKWHNPVATVGGTTETVWKRTK
jgi:hypothetical protein